MDIVFSKKFYRNHTKLDLKIKQRFINRLKLFRKNRYHPILNNHKLQGGWINHNSINITSDIRAIYIKEGGIIIFKTIGTHSDLYQ